MSEKQQKRPHWRVPILVSALGIPIVGALLVDIVTLLILNSGGTAHITWSSAGTIALSLLVSAVVLFLVFVLGIIFTLRVLFGIFNELLDDVFKALPKPGEASGANPVDEFLLNITHSLIMPKSAREEGKVPDVKEVIEEAVSQFTKGHESSKEPPAAS